VRSLEEAAWLRGYFHARDRLIQVQLTLAIARGSALALLGDNLVARHIDRITRIHRFTGDLDEQVTAVKGEARAQLDAYCTGFNAGAKQRGWPLLLRAAGIRPAPYRPQDLTLIYRLISWFGLTQLAETPPLIIGELMSRGVDRKALRVLVGDAASEEELAQAPVATWPSELALLAGSGLQGSNALAVAGTHSATGGALLAGDPHMEIARIPPVLYATHTAIGDDCVTGMSVPGLFWPSFGRTKHVAWTYTYAHVPSVNVRIVRVRNGTYQDGSEWKPLRKRTEQVKIRRKSAESWTFWDGELGTIVGPVDAEAETLLPCLEWFGLRSTGNEINACGELLRAKTVEELVATNRALTTLALDGVFADSSGRIAHVVSGGRSRVPGGSYGAVPRAADGPSAAVDEATRPTTTAPVEGYLVSANARAVEPDAIAWAPTPEARPRIERLRELMVAKRTSFSLDDLARNLLDTCDAGARRLLAVWATRLPDHPRVHALVKWSANQSGRGDEHFASLTLWTVFHNEVCRQLLADMLGEPAAKRLLDELSGLPLFQYHLDDALALTFPDVVDDAKLRTILARAWPIALVKVADATIRLPRRDRFKNFLLAGKLSLLGFDSKPITNHGGPTTPNQVTAVQVGGQQFVFGAACRFLVDMSKPGIWYCMSGGASERRFGLGYGKGLDAWARGEFLPFGGATGAPPKVS
jgi:penicillin amidase